MTETRKKIIELISDYMDKTLSEGCLILSKGEIYKTALGDIQFSKVMRDSKLGDIHMVTIGGGYAQVDKVIGHYDITAVLKYTKGTGYFIDISFMELSDFFRLEGNPNKDYIGSSIKIPNKPLNLYTEQEEKDLLDLLFKLK